MQINGHLLTEMILPMASEVKITPPTVKPGAFNALSQRSRLFSIQYNSTQICGYFSFSKSDTPRVVGKFDIIS